MGRPSAVLVLAPLCALAALWSSCLGNNPPAPPVRWFDPSPPAAAVAPTGAACRAPQVAAAVHLGQPFALRIGAREFAFDDQFQWVAPPERLVAQALEQSLFGSGRCARAPGAGAAVLVTRFELDLTGDPTAVVELMVTAAAERRCLGTAPAASRQPADVAAAMAAALAAACEQAVAALQ